MKKELIRQILEMIKMPSGYSFLNKLSVNDLECLLFHIKEQTK